MAILTKEQLSSRASRLFDSYIEKAYSARTAQTSIFLSHKHTDKKEVKEAKRLLEGIGIKIYVDWLDPDMPKETRGETAIRIKQKIKENDKFILLATDEAVASKWCNWELGHGDAEKLLSDKIALFPVREYSRSWTGSEYMQIYPVIEYEDGSNSNTNNQTISEGYYIFYPSVNLSRNYIALKTWLLK
ncbi:MAG: toll/interleukin-1 receptor domain-containing protein [Candidatus Woesearchaeota archaeon]